MCLAISFEGTRSILATVITTETKDLLPQLSLNLGTELLEDIQNGTFD
jgi:hypothetical protein